MPEGHENIEDSPVYTIGQEIDVSSETARHFINKGVAEELTPKNRQARDVQKPIDKPAEEAKPVGK